MTRKAPRPRRERRAAERQVRKTREDLGRLYALEPGGSADRPIELRSASEVEPAAADRRCPYCDGGVRLTEHAATERDGARLRVARIVCTACHTPFVRYFRLGSSLN